MLSKKREYLVDFPHQGEIWLINFNNLGEEVIKIRPALIISNNLQNEFDSQVMVAIVTSEESVVSSSGGILVKKKEVTNLERDSKLLPNRIHTIFKTKDRFLKKLGKVDKNTWLRFKKNHFWTIYGDEK
ncbi:MAG: hypothetical protein GBAus27B_000132 [Mycoplasmataceae bacterium]|nr:MAG: hypothetical protein GBAus27B_000132 [Mycoplasmataceae bacterium]